MRKSIIDAPVAAAARTLAAIALVMPALSAPCANAASFVVSPGGDNKVVFVSRAAVESFEGKTRALTGRIAVDPAAVGDSVTVHFEVELMTLDTGIGRRNQHMRKNHLETDKYPRATFEGATVAGPAGARLAMDQPVTLDVEGTFTLHGVSRRLRIAVEATRIRRGDADRIAFRTSFPVRLSDYAISRPQFLFLKLAETQEVRVNGVAVAAAEK